MSFSLFRPKIKKYSTNIGTTTTKQIPMKKHKSSAKINANNAPNQKPLERNDLKYII